MKKSGEINELFLPDGCLTGSALEYFLAGNLSKTDQQLVEQHLAICEMCRDAVEGYRSENISEIPDDLMERIHLKTLKAAGSNIKKPLIQKKIIPYISLAASLILLIGLFFMFRKITGVHTKMIAEQQEEQVAAAPAEKEVIPEKKIIVSKEKNANPVISGQKVITKENIKSAMKKPETEVPVVPPKKIVNEQLTVSQRNQSVPVEVKNNIETESTDEIAIKANTSGNAAFTSAIAKKDQSGQQEKIQRMTDNNINSYKETFADETAGEPVFAAVEALPTFKGGDLGKFATYVQEHLKYPPEAAQMGVEGKVFVNFVVDSTGNISDVKVLRGVDSLLDREAVRVISQSPKWKPGYQRGKPVNVQFTVPVIFKISNK